MRVPRTGLSPALVPHVSRTVRIPMDPAVESLNAATAASLLLYQLYRQRRQKERHSGGERRE